MPENEDLLVIPDDWRTSLHPRRGGTPAPPLELVPDAVSAVQEWVRESRDQIDHLLGGPLSDEALTRPARAHLLGDANPRGAAVLAAVLAAEWPLRDGYEYGTEPFATFADAWIVEHGPAFAAAAAVELGGVFVEGYGHRKREHVRHLRARRLDEHDPGYNRGLDCLELVAARVRAFLAAASEPEYRQAVETLAEHRRDGMRRLVAAYLVPTETAWSDELCRDLPDLRPHTWMMVLRTIGSAGQLAALLARRDGWYWLDGRPGVLATAVEGVGPALAPTLAAVADEEAGIGRDPSGLLRALGVLATDEAFRLLVDRLDRPHAHAAVIEAARRCPGRARRLLGEAAASGPAPISSYAARLLRDHVAPETGAVAAGSAREAPAESLPRLLVEPPWTRDRPAFRRVTVRGITPAADVPERATDVRALVPLALGKVGPRRYRAEAALRRLAAAEGEAAILEVAAEHGAAAAKAAGALLAADPLDDLPQAMPRQPVWVDPYLLPQVVLRENGLALPLDAVGHLVSMLSISTPDKPYAGIAAVKEICEPADLAELAWRLFASSGLRERPHDTDGTGWALTALGLLGDDETVRRLTPVIRTWPGDGGHHMAVKGLDVLLAIGSEVALLHLHNLATDLKYKGLRRKAQERIDALAGDLGLSGDQLGDRLVPDFGLDGNGGTYLDYGPRGFTVGFDELLRPYVMDGAGRRRATLPKPGVRDDPELAPAAQKRFAALKKDVRTVAGERLRRFEQAMVTRQLWTAEEFRTLITAHPLVRHLARRLVWITEDGRTFRVAEDRTLAGLRDDETLLGGSSRVGVAHPLQLSGDLAAWAEVFGDYEILQPFPQLNRFTYALTGEERAGTELARFHGVTVPVGGLLGLERRGWRRGSAEDGGVQVDVLRELPGGRALVVDISPGIAVGDLGFWPEQRIDRVRLDRGTLGDLDAITASEILADLVDLIT
ncbi:DUF4132 domain-containing protein [Actinomadura sp. WMMB 499]|uniref:DUF4132 domain-containing protein n=1 Tax=Actinomadura sp. WMMB 499 TaxID=1219491 RepID=UPI001244B15B|nr:DUF4132 domain-containing protein [Actinomadura sp. WMMB 499]QFG23456.1 DUF4132 domain-containing protein [Actinomadura sp. WMMB 499]